MKLYETARAPNPRRARMFMAEKGIDLNDVERIELDLAAGDNLSADFKQKNPMGGVPTLELDDGTFISESMAISRYFEEIHPEPPLMGRDALDKARVEMWNRRMELGLLFPVALAFRNITATFADREKCSREFGEISLERATKMFGFVDRHLADSQYIAGDVFTVADITALCAVDFARVVKLRIGEDQSHLARWHEQVSARASASA
ncbi:glutathione S-transferase [Salinisphaera sp. T31B1]|uniref:glutathione S-transferase family protein n=1 Tax=Salinisphaera sp. T31B1 TaxID=727963 RepID=UPI003342AF79